MRFLLFYNPLSFDSSGNFKNSKVGYTFLFLKFILSDFYFFFQAGSAFFYSPVSHEIKQQLRAHLGSMTRNLPEDLQYVLKNSCQRIQVKFSCV